MAKRKKRSTQNDVKRTIQYEVIGLALIALSLMAIIELGAVGKSVVFLFRFFLGEWYIVACLSLIGAALYMMVKRTPPPMFTKRLAGLYALTVSFLLLSHVKLFELMSNNGRFDSPSVIANTWHMFWNDLRGDVTTSDLGGGMIGAVLFAVSHFLFDSLGTFILCFILIIIGVFLLTGISFGAIAGKIAQSFSEMIKTQWEAFQSDYRQWKEEQANKRELKKEEKRLAKERKEEEKQNPPTIINASSSSKKEEVVEKQTSEARTIPKISMFTDKTEVEDAGKIIEKKPETKKEADIPSPPVAMNFVEEENQSYELPPIKLLKRPKQTDQSNEYQMIHKNAAKLEETFESFGVKAKVTQVHLGPAVTKYEVQPNTGVKVSKIVSLSDDLALALAAKDIRIEAPIPGKSAIGIEVPNSEVAMVSLREVLESKQNNNPAAKLRIGLGRDITGEAVLAELNKMPHLLVAGATGSGKSVCINGIITSILMRAKPHEVKLMMIDPKMVELNVYNGVPHLLAPVVTDPKRASQALKKVVNEMERRYELFSHTGTRNIEGYNDHVTRHNEQTGEKQPKLPFIVVIVDELADLMMVASNEVEDAITRLAQMARAAGIHLIIATQRPSVDVITGVIKANIPSRIAFAVSSQIDSRTILDMGGAEKLLGRGDMLFLPIGASKPIRVQGAFLSDDEVEEIVDFVIDQQKAQYQEEMIPDETVEVTEEVEDELYDEAVQLIAEMQTASVSMLQRRFRVGYTRAARLIDAMEQRGVVGPYEGSKPRAVLIGKPSEDQTM
ncbi:DNA translocase FtsK [Mangrovibacillus cuniculi]|uniref:DNA translocase FtsK n=1 Tax=Mangrovibacillus cuniculi TaxID=2593652 RepID=A0A7S8HFG4_9BACI|nr:DNA translocase FtsK [Mangrovibacillus cuniculi]QPC46400.1 DNA translocase FtsK [Mangrovibacillus cuniculi]